LTRRLVALEVLLPALVLPSREGPECEVTAESRLDTTAAAAMHRAEDSEQPPAACALADLVPCDGHAWIPVVATTAVLGHADTVRVFGLSAEKYNDRFGSTLRRDGDRYIVVFSSSEPPVKIKPANLQFPARCPASDYEVTGNGCWGCGFGLSKDDRS